MPSKSASRARSRWWNTRCASTRVTSRGSRSSCAFATSPTRSASRWSRIRNTTTATGASSRGCGSRHRAARQRWLAKTAPCGAWWRRVAKRWCATGSTSRRPSPPAPRGVRSSLPPVGWLAGRTRSCSWSARSRDFSFLRQDGARGALEHCNSDTLGMPSAELARDPSALLAETAHEYFHTWNLMRIHPAEYGDVAYRPPRRSRGLWWSEGLTMLYADLLLRRAGLPTLDSSRVAHVEGLIGRYLASPGNSRFSPESVSVLAYGAPPGSLGDYSASTHLQGELLGTMLDLIVRDATSGARSIDDVMRAMLERFSGARGFTGRDRSEEHTSELQSHHDLVC